MELTSDNLLVFVQDFKDKLLSEGDADQLAQHFVNQGVQAYCGIASKCAIAQALTDAIQAEFAVPDQIFIGVSVSTNISASVNTISAVAVEAGEQLVRFMQRFDAGVYRALIDQYDWNGQARAAGVERALHGVAPERRDTVLVRDLGIPGPS